MGNILSYSYVIPRIWNDRYTSQELVDQVWDQLSTFLDEDVNFNGPIIVIDGVATVLQVMNNRLCWWFMIPRDRYPTSERYFFSDNYLNFGHWRNFNENGVDDDADTIILDDLNNDENYVRDQIEAARQQEIRDQQIRLIHRLRHGANINDDEGAELDPLFEDTGNQIPTCQDPDSKMQELEREIFKLKTENDQLKEKMQELD